MAHAIYKAGHALVPVLFRALGGYEKVHQERVPRVGPLIVAPNHLSFADPPLVGCATRRRLRYMAKRELFLPLGIGWLLRALGAFPVSRGAVDIRAMRRALELLREGEAVLVFPEGGRGDGKTLRMPEQGVSLLAKRSGAPVIPVGIVGSDRVLPRGAKFFHRGKTSVIWGEPFGYEDATRGLAEREARAHFARELISRVWALIAERAEPPTLPWEAEAASTS
jgi:1-acyl-sn-glycerol-3-phosphate acyltransferase